MARDTMTVPREVLVETLAFIESEMHWSQPAPDMGEEPSNQFTYDAIPVAMALREALSSSDPEGGARGERDVQGSIATKQATDETAASVLSEPPEAWADCETCGGEGAINRTIHVYENGCGFSHPDVEIIPCTDCMGTGGAIVDAASTYCDICGGDCSSANPPVFNCPLAKQESCPESAPRTETTVRDWRKSVFTYEHDDAAGHLYYFAPQVTAPGPFLEQRHVQAIVDIASDGTFAGVELIDNMPPLIRSGGADTESDGGTSPSNETRGGAGDDCSVGKRGAWPHHDGQVCAQRLNVENQNPDVTGGESAAPNSPAVAETRRAGSAGLSPGDGFSDPAPSRVEER